MIQQPWPSAAYGGYGAMYTVVRELPPGITARARRESRAAADSRSADFLVTGSALRVCIVTLPVRCRGAPAESIATPRRPGLDGAARSGSPSQRGRGGGNE